MQPFLYQADHGPCPYLPDRRWVTVDFELSRMPGAAYEELLRGGWRRSGHVFYHNQCPGCRCCIPIRLPVAGFAPSRSQRRAIRRNADVSVRTDRPAEDPEVLDLYRRYIHARHDPEDPGDPGQFRRFLLDSPLRTQEMRYTVGDRLVGIGWVDILPDGISSVYFAFDPSESRRSLGTFSVTREIRYARELGKSWVYLGFYVPGSAKMAYKGTFAPREYAVDGAWTDGAEALPC